MSTKYLDDTGLSYFWGKIKAWANSVFALISHTHPSSDVTLMTGYSKPSSGSAISSSDTLNAAVGKLEAKVDAIDQSNVVHITGAESITGTKSFKDSLNLYNSSLTKGTSPNLTQYYSISFTDNSLSNRFGLFETAVNNQGDVTTYIASYKNEANSPATLLGVACLADGTKYGFAPDTPTTRNDATDIVTRGFIPNDIRIVHSTGNENIYGWKTFNKPINIIHEGLTKGTNPSSNSYRRINFDIENLPSGWTGNQIGDFYCNVNADGSVHTGISCCHYGNDNNSAEIKIVYPKTGDAYTLANAPIPDNDSTTKIATTAWVQRFCTVTKGFLTSHQSLANYVTLNGTQSITGAKTFTQSIEINRSNPYVVFVETDLKKGTGTDSGGTSYQGLYFEDKSEAIVGSIIGNIYGGTDKQYWITLRARDFRTASATDEAVVGCEYNSAGTKSFRPEPTNSTLLGTSSRRWKEIWCNQSSINTSSDERIKDSISDIPDEVLDAWGDVRWRQFKYKDAVAEKGSGARIHSGAVAQEVDRAFHAHNLDVSGYGLFLHDSWEAVEETRDDKGTILSYASPAGDEYGLRYVEALCMEAAYMRRENARLKKRVADLEDRLAALELRLGSE